MPDKFSEKTRSKIMSSIRGKNTTPEMLIRKHLWSSGARYRIHDNSILGRPDIAFKGKKTAVFIDGCFWHACKSCYKEPKTNRIFWRKKITQNTNRRKKVKSALKKDGWTVLEFWEHEIRTDPNAITNIIKSKVNYI